MKRQVKYAEVVFFEILINSFGGLKRVSKLLGRDYFQVNNWKCRGYVPPREVAHVAKTLKITPTVLNNKIFSSIADWKKEITTVKSLTKEQLNYISSLPVRYK